MLAEAGIADRRRVGGVGSKQHDALSGALN
jgi:hypothetical protein